MVHRIAYAIAWVILRPLLALLGGCRVEGRRNVPRHGAVILAPNHASFADPPLLALGSPRPVWFMAKSILFERPWLAPLLRLYQAFPVAVSGIDRAALRRGEELLQRGEVLCIFAEGGVSDDGRLQPLKPGLALLALRAGTPIVPVGIVRSHRLLSPRRPLLRFVPHGVAVRIGPPLDLTDLPTTAARGDQIEWINRRLYAAIAALLPPEQQPMP